MKLPAYTPYDGSSKPFTIGLMPLDIGRWIEPDADLARYLAEKRGLLAARRQDVFVAAMTEKLMMYGVGRETKYSDMPTVRAVMRDAAKNRYRFSDLILGVVKSAPFQMKVKS